MKAYKFKKNYQKKVTKPAPLFVENTKALKETRVLLKKLKYKDFRQTKRLLRNPKELSEFLKVNNYDYKVKPIFYETHQFLKYLTDIYALIIKHSYEKNFERFNQPAVKQNKNMEILMRKELDNEKKEIKNHFNRLVKSHNPDKYKFTRLYKKLKTNYGYRRFFNILNLGRAVDTVDLPVKKLDTVNHFILKQTLRHIPTTFRSLAPFIIAVYDFQKLAYNLTDRRLTNFLFESKSSYRKYVNQWLAFVKNNPFIIKNLSSDLDKFTNKVSHKLRTGSSTNVKSLAQSIFAKKLIKLFLIPSFASKYITPGKKKYLRIMYERRLQKFINLKFKLRARFPLDRKSIRRYTIKRLTNVGSWATILAQLNRSDVVTRILQNYVAIGYPRSTLQDLYLYTKTISFKEVMKSYPKFMICLLNQRIPYLFSGKSIKSLLGENQLTHKNVTKAFINDIANKNGRIETESDFFFFKFLNIRKRVLSKEQVSKIDTLMNLVRLSKSSYRIRSALKLQFAKALDMAIKQRRLYQIKEGFNKKRYHHKTNYKKNSRFWLSNSKIPPFRIILRQSANNFFVTATVDHGRVINNFTSGLVGLKGPSRSTSFAAGQVGRAVGSTLTQMDAGPSLCIFKSPLTHKIRALTVGIYSTFKKIKAFLDLIPRSHNGLRLPKPRRL